MPATVLGKRGGTLKRKSKRNRQPNRPKHRKHVERFCFDRGAIPVWPAKLITQLEPSQQVDLLFHNVRFQLERDRRKLRRFVAL